ncbi:hypothetical protein HAX54_006645 [Datura stramonium]|uniref:Uncharacterized protein n=1 Tax=Datura stramonium TaxID=4076 RepID=A0ABS8TD64_DATST|nr:hypothetical protein [Datura stramonium]
MTSAGGWSHYREGVPCVETIKLVDKMWRREGKKDAMLLGMMKKMELLMNYVKGFHAMNSHAIHDYDDGYYGNQAPIVANNMAPMKDIVDNDVLEWEIQEEAIEELIVDVFLNGEELEEIHHLHKEPAKDMLTHLCLKVDVLETEVTTLKQEVATLTAPTSQLTPCGHEVVPPQVKAPRSPRDDWWVSYHSESDIISDEEAYHSPASPPPIRSVYDVNPSWTLGRVATTSYHEL